jgi:hypothetical protein
MVSQRAWKMKLAGTLKDISVFFFFFCQKLILIDIGSVLGFKSIGYVQLILAPPSSPLPSRRTSGNKQGREAAKPPMLSPLVMSLSFGVLIIGAALLVPHFRLPSSPQ